MADPDVACTTRINIPFERSIYVGNMLSGILYGESSFLQTKRKQSFRSHFTHEIGLDIFAFFASVYCISNHSPDYRKGQIFYIVIGGILLALITICVAMDALWGQYMWIDHRNYPGGPLGYFAASQTEWFNVFGMAAAATANILGDGLLVRLISRSAGEKV